MGQPRNTESRDNPADPRDISKWARIYGQNRSLPLVVFLAFFLLFFVAIGGLSYLAGQAYLDGNTVLFWICIAALVFALAALIYFSLWGQKHVEEIVRRCYRKEGDVAVSSEKTAYPPHVTGLLLGAFMVCVFASAILGVHGYIPDKYMQPVSAVYCVPFLVVLTFRMRPAVGWLGLLWPGLYGLHAILVVAGAPILFTGTWQGLNILLPVAGYGMLTGLAGHAYSRFALRRLKRSARFGLAGTDQSKEAQG